MFYTPLVTKTIYTLLIGFNIRQKLGDLKMKYKCIVCEYIYNPQNGDPDNGIDAGTSFEDLPDDWVCPLCFVGKDQFEPI